MYLTSLKVSNFRIIERLSFEPGPGLNLILGENAAGKTSLLEAIYLLGRGRSFRGPGLRMVVGRGGSETTVYGEVLGKEGTRARIGVRKGRGRGEIRLGGGVVRASSDLARVLPMALLTPESHRLLEEGPAQRRRLMDWALFHVEPGYLDLLGRYTRVLRQRNAALRAGAPPTQIRVWDGSLAVLGQELHVLRRALVSALLEPIRRHTLQLLGQPLLVTYVPGWEAARPLSEELATHLVTDRRAGYTTRGPHRADLSFRLGEARVPKEVSRGQAKLVVVAVILAQVEYLGGVRGEMPVLLLDDMASELDEHRRDLLWEDLIRLGCQCFVTRIGANGTGRTGGLRDQRDVRMFHVEQGYLRVLV